MIFVPPRFAADSILEAEDAGIEPDHRITEGIPAHDELRVYNHLASNPDVAPRRPELPGILSPGKANVGIIPASFFSRGQRRRRLALGHADLPDRQRAGPARLRQLEHRRHRRRPGPGLELHRHHRAVRGRPETELIVMAGEIGGSAEEEAAEFIAENVSKPVVAYIAGFTAPPGKTMGHAGAIVSGTAGTAVAKQEALEARGVRVGRTPTEVAEIAAEIAAHWRAERSAPTGAAPRAATTSGLRSRSRGRAASLHADRPAPCGAPPRRRSRGRATSTAASPRGRGPRSSARTRRRPGRSRWTSSGARWSADRRPAGRMLVMRLRSDGRRDPRFGRHGVTTVTLPGIAPGRRARPRRVPRRPIVLAATVESPDGSAPARIAVARLLPDGDLDPGFGDDGIAIVGPDGATRARSR
jgi:succinyl-CoA synthetase alpha subunit